MTLVTFVIFFVIPADPARQACGQRATPQCIERARHFLGIDRPVVVQYARFIDRLVIHQSLGHSFTNRQDVTHQVLQAAPVTASLVFGGAVLWLLISIPIGILSALRPRSLLDRTTMIAVLIGISAHPVWIGLLAAYFAGFKLHLFPISGYCNFFTVELRLRRPGAVGVPPVPAVGDVRGAVRCHLRADDPRLRDRDADEDFVRTARAKGASEARVLRRARRAECAAAGRDDPRYGHRPRARRGVLHETVFGLPGLGRLAVGAIDSFDLATIQGVVVFATLCVIVFNLIVDTLYAWVDPRIRLS